MGPFPSVDISADVLTIFLSHTGLFYGGVCIAMAALASLLGALLQVSARLLSHVCQII